MHASSSLLQRLRDATQAAHSSLDKGFGQLDLAEKDGFGRFLEAHYIGMAPLAGYMDSFAKAELDMTAPGYPTLLAADLADLGRDAATLPTLDPEPGLNASAVAYVLAGSRLGLATIRKQPFWGREHDVACRYMDEDHGLALWRALAEWMRDRVPSAQEAEAACASASAAFELFAAALAIRAPAQATG